jgi:uncharacterized membrane protein
MTSPAPTFGDAPSQKTAQRMGAMLVGMGVLHFVAPKPFDTIVPAELPGTPRFYTLASGVAEAATGAMLYVGVFPANVNSIRVFWSKGWPARVASIARLPLQVPMITQALKVYRNAPR